MKQVIDQYIEKYGPDNSPPPWQTFTIAHKPGQGNLHLIQKVFEGPFEVRRTQAENYSLTESSVV